MTTTKTHLHTGQELAEPLVLLADLEGQLPGVAHHQHGHLVVTRLVQDKMYFSRIAMNIYENDLSTKLASLLSEGSIGINIRESLIIIINLPDHLQALSAEEWPEQRQQSCPSLTWPGRGCPCPAQSKHRQYYICTQKLVNSLC